MNVISVVNLLLTAPGKRTLRNCQTPSLVLSMANHLPIGAGPLGDGTTPSEGNARTEPRIAGEVPR